MMVEYEKPPVSKSGGNYTKDLFDDRLTDGVPSIDRSVAHPRSPTSMVRGTTERIMSTSKFLLNDPEEDDRLSNITDIVCDTDEDKFRELYNH